MCSRPCMRSMTSKRAMETSSGRRLPKMAARIGIGYRISYLGKNSALGEWLKNEDSVRRLLPGEESKLLYPQYRRSWSGSAQHRHAHRSVLAFGVAVEKAIAAQSPKDGEVHVLPVQGNVYMLIADGTNITVSLGARRHPARELRFGEDVRQDPRRCRSARQAILTTRRPTTASVRTVLDPGDGRVRTSAR